MGEVSYRPHVVFLHDLTSDQIMEIAHWIIASEMGHVAIDEGVDVSDFSSDADVLYRYAFDRKEDALMFQLKWKTK